MSTSTTSAARWTVRKNASLSARSEASATSWVRDNDAPAVDKIHPLPAHILVHPGARGGLRPERKFVVRARLAHAGSPDRSRALHRIFADRARAYPSSLG